MKVKDGLNLILIFFGIYFISCTPKNIALSVWQYKSVTVDASNVEYVNTDSYDEDTRMLYSISNDSSNLYLCFEIKDELIQEQILIAGMEVWLDTTHKRKEKMGILYPITLNKPMGEKPNFSGGAIQKPDFSLLKHSLLLSQNFMELVGLKNVGSSSLPLEYSSGLKVKLNWDSKNAMIYEMRIPFKTWYKEITLGDTNRVFSLVVNIKALSMPDMGPGGMMGPPPQGGNGDMGGGLPGGRPPMDGSMNRMSAMSVKRTLKVNFKLNIHEKFN